MAALGVAADAVQDVILTHLHYDHSGHFDRFANARFHLQEKELHFATGKYMRHPRMSYSFEVDDVCGIVRMNYKQRLMFYDGCLLYTSPSPRDRQKPRMPSSA